MGGRLCKDTSLHSVEARRASVALTDVIQDKHTHDHFVRLTERIHPRTVVDELHSGGVEHLCEMMLKTADGQSDSARLESLLTTFYRLAVESGSYGPFLEGMTNLDCLPTDADLQALYKLLPALIGQSTGLSNWLTILSQGPPVLTTNQEMQKGIINDNEAFLISQISAVACGAFAHGPPSLLFSVRKNGESWMRFVDSVANYPGPALLIIRTKHQEILGAFIDGGVTETGTKFSGSPETFLFALRPTLKICKSSGNGSNYTILNHRSAFVPVGLGFGGDEKSYRLRLHDDLKHVTVSVSCTTFTYGALLDMTDDQDGSECFTKTTALEDAEVWGLGGKHHLAEQTRVRERDENMKADRRMVDKSKLLEGGDIIKKPAAGERQGEVDVILEERRRQKEEAKKGH